MILPLLRIILGSILIILGIVGFLIPFIPGWPAFLLGTGMLAPKKGKIFVEKVRQKTSEFWHKIKNWVKKK